MEDHPSTLDGFRRLGRLLVAMNKFADLKVYADSDEDIRWLNKTLKPRKTRELARVFKNLAKRGVVFRLYGG